MKPRLLLLFALLAESFLLFTAFPRAAQNQNPPPMADSTQWRNDPTPEAERMLQREIAWAKWRPRLVWTLLTANGVFILLCGIQVLKRRHRDGGTPPTERAALK